MGKWFGQVTFGKKFCKLMDSYVHLVLQITGGSPNLLNFPSLPTVAMTKLKCMHLFLNIVCCLV